MTGQEPTFVDNLTAFVEALGFDHVHVAWELAKGNWESPDHRQGFINGLTGDWNA